MKTVIPFWKRSILLRTFVFALSILILQNTALSQATVSNPIGIGRNCNGSGSDSVKTWSYNGTTNTLQHTNRCRPTLASPGFSAGLSSVTYNPGDGYLYYIRIRLVSGVYNSYVYRWNPATCPGGTVPVFRTFNNQFIAGVEFDPNGVGYQINLTGTSAPYGVELQQVDLGAGTTGPSIPVNLPSGINIWQQNGDIMMTPSGQFLFVFNNKYFTVNYQDYNVNPLNATYIDSLELGPNNNLVGLAYADGELIASVRSTPSGTCFYRQINILNGDTSNVTNGAGTHSAYDLTNVTSGIGVSKQLVSAVPTGTPGQYDLSYDIRVQNMGDYPLRNVQIVESFNSLHPLGAANVTNITASFVSNAGDLALNPSFNGKTNTNLLTGTDSLYHFPVNQNFSIIRVTARISNVVPGTAYLNSVTATASGFNGVALSDVSTNGDNPDPNDNDKPDDPGENQPTPFIVSTAAETPPCETLSSVLYQQTFGTGTGLATAMPGTSGTGYTPKSTSPVNIEQYALTNNASQGDPSHWINLTDHTGNANGRMMVVNADNLNSRIFYDEVDINCSNLKYSFYLYAAFIGNASYQTLCNSFGGFKYPRMTFTVRNADDNSIIANVTTPDITSTTWTQYGMKWIMPAGVTRVILEVYNSGAGGCGNDLAIDDINFGLCDPEPTVNISGISDGCIGGTTTFNTALSDTTGYGTIEYQWQRSTDNVTWTNISGATSASYVLTAVTLADAVYYRILVAAPGNLSNPSCRFTSNAYQLTLKSSSVAASAAFANRPVICPNDPVTLAVSGGTLGTNAVWRWYTSSCGGTLVGTGATINVNPSSTTTYYVRAEGDCNTTSCVSVTVTVSCDIDDDNDGITDLAESGGVDPNSDDDMDGIPNYLDTNFPGFVDSNSDGVNDNFDNDLDGIINSLDRDSDNDGIPDVVESGGVDANGDGVIDNYTDTDADGLSQNVDANNTGASGSGTGLGLVDTDGDGIPNVFDLDSDNDGIPDVVEAGGTDANNNGRIDGYADADGDGFADAVDGDADNNSIAENSANALLRTGADGNNDGRADSYPYKNFDSDTRANAYDLDSDNDGITDVREAGFADANSDGFADGSRGSDGWSDTIDALATLNLANSDADANPDYLDIDSDNDGIPDNVEGPSTSSYRLPTGLDSDNDGLDNAYDLTSGFGGNGNTPNDQDGDGTPDYRDVDTDGDGSPDRVEGNDYNSNCDNDDSVDPLGTDTDGDGLDDRYDASNTSVEGTAFSMGNLGTTSGDMTPGSNTMIGMCNTSGFERDWRYMAYVLEVNFHSISGIKKDNGSLVRWVISCSRAVDYFVIERSIDGKNFTTLGRVEGPGVSCELKAFEYLDATASNVKMHYRIKAVDKQYHHAMSRPVTVTGLNKDEIIVYPNPVTDAVHISLNLKEAAAVNIKVINAAGRTVHMERQQLFKGANTVEIEQSRNFVKGIYYLIIEKDGVVTQHKVVVQ